MLFVLCSNLSSAVVEEAQSLSFASLVKKWVSDLVDFMESVAIDGWDSAPAGQLHAWYTASMKTLQSSDRTQFLFDPTVLLLRLMLHFQTTLQERHSFAINRQGRNNTSVLIPLEFIQKWRDDLLKQMETDTSIIQGLLLPDA